MKISSLVITAFLVFCGLGISAQTFSPAFAGYSRKKTTYITMKDGTEHSVFIKNLKFKKGLIDELKVEQASNGKKVKINPEDIDHMYVPPSALAKVAQVTDAMTDINKIQDGELDNTHLDDGYLYMESSNVQVKKKKTQYCMLQLMNPTFSKSVQVYNDPLSNESAGIGVAGINVAGGLAKSYYIKLAGQDTAMRISKKDYKKEMEEIFTDCSKVVGKYSADPKWVEFEQFIFDYTTQCN